MSDEIFTILTQKNFHEKNCMIKFSATTNIFSWLLNWVKAEKFYFVGNLFQFFFLL